MKLEGLYLVEQGEENDKSVIYLCQRLKNGEKKIQVARAFKPYFYVDENENVLKGFEVEHGYESLFGDKLKKVILKKSRNVREVRNTFKRHFEADIIYTNRFLIDEVDEIEKTDYKTFHIDIETLSEGGFPNVDTANQPVICLTIYDSFTKTYDTWIWRKDFETSMAASVKKFSNEKDMLEDVIKYFQIRQPDIITGWNVLFFDMKYLINRMKNLGLNVNKLSPLNSAYVSKPREGGSRLFQGDPFIKGVVIFDLLKHYRKVHKGELSSFSLNSVAEEELGEQKISTHHVIDDDWKTDNWMNVVKYNKKDVELTVKIDEKTGIINFFDEMRILAHCNFDDCKYYGRIVDMFILRYARERNIVLPSKKPFDPDRKLAGGFVHEPKIGLYDNVVVIDLNQLYPSLIQTFNLSPETKTEDGEIDINGVKFTKNKQGIVPSILDELSKIRTSYKKKMKELRYDDPEFTIYDNKQQAAKNLICTVYGVNALSTFRLNTDYVAQTITYLGRELNKWMTTEVEKEGHKVIYGDTDSIFIQIDSEDFIGEGKKLATMLNGKLGLFAERFNVKEHTLELDLEKAYKKIMIGAKKRYAGLVCWKDGKPEDDIMRVVGFDSKRSDTSIYSKDIQNNLFEMILRDGKKEDVFEFIENKIANIKDQSYTDIAIPVKFEKPLKDYKTNIPRVRGAKLANELFNTNYGAGNKILMLYTKGEKMKKDCICFEEVEQFKRYNFKLDIDYDKLIDKLILMKVKRLLIAAGWEDDYDELVDKYVRTPRKKVMLERREERKKERQNGKI